MNENLPEKYMRVGMVEKEKITLRQCPHCLEMIDSRARRCKYCGRKILSETNKLFKKIFFISLISLPAGPILAFLFDEFLPLNFAQLSQLICFGYPIMVIIALIISLIFWLQ